MTNSIPENSKSVSLLDELKIINNLINRICSIKETNHIMETIISELIKITDSDQGVINLLSTSKEDGLVTVIRDNEQNVDDLPFKVNDQISGWVLKNKRLIKIDDFANDERFTGFDNEIGQCKSILCCPMIVRDKILGLTTLIRSRVKAPFNDNHCRLVGILTSQSAQILSNAKLLEELASANELLKISQDKLKKENLRLNSELKASFGFENIIGKSLEMKKVLSLISKYCVTDSTVLITGETGTGKELIAKAIHYNSRRKDKNFVIKNCGVKTESLLESELFGHIRGSFTGAVKDKIGLFKEADGGTIFLDEIGDAPQATQVAILRVIQSGEIRPIGASKTEFVDVRVISATNKNLKEEIEKENFRQDLFYRLNTFLIELPALHRRKDDIPLLVNHFLDKLKIKIGRDKLSISQDALDVLMKYSWPGNIRQLENELERAAVVCGSDGCINVKNISPELIVSSDEYGDTGNYQGRLRDIVEKVEVDLITSTLAEYKGNIVQTSKALGVSRQGLKDKIARYKIDLDDSDAI